MNWDSYLLVGLLFSAYKKKLTTLEKIWNTTVVDKMELNSRAKCSYF